jgi:hypothetical protein
VLQAHLLDQHSLFSALSCAPLRLPSSGPTVASMLPSALVGNDTGTTAPRQPLDCRVTACPSRMSRRHHYHVYVVELSPEVLREARFCRANPDYVPGRPCVYVGMTGLDPDLRFDKHKAGIQSNRYVFQFGLRLLPQLYECYNPMPYDGARDMEVELAIALREQGYGVWQA